VPDTIFVNMLGTFSLRLGDQTVDDGSNRTRKVWLLLAYLIYNRESRASQENYLALLQGGAEESADPNGRLKAVFYRARTMLEKLGSGLGHELIIRKNGTYAWNTQQPLQLDVEEFERLCAEAAAREEDRLELYLRALELYRGDFLPKISMESWVIPLSAYYHQMYLDAAEQALALLEEMADWSRAEELCRKALRIEPYSEALYQHLMRCLVARGDRAAALRAYDEMSEILFSTFGAIPSEESRSLYREASRESGSTVPTGSVRDHLREPEAAKGAMYCEYDFFKLLYQVQARALIRSGETVHIALFSIHGQRNKELARRSLDRIMENLREVIASNLRQGDVFTCCSASQFILMLPQANYENSGMVCQRIIRAFFRKYPHSPAEIRYSVQPLEPAVPESAPTL